MMNFDELKQILEMVREHELTEFELEREGLKLRIKKNGSVSVTPAGGAVVPAAPAKVGSAAMAVPPATPGSSGPAGPVSEVSGSGEIELAVVKSPIVGTFYRSPESGAPPFVGVGDRVKRGQVLCIIEAMKLMNGIESEYDGEVVTAYVENGQPVQYGERLFAIRTD